MDDSNRKIKTSTPFPRKKKKGPASLSLLLIGVLHVDFITMLLSFGHHSLSLTIGTSKHDGLLACFWAIPNSTQKAHRQDDNNGAEV